MDKKAWSRMKFSIGVKIAGGFAVVLLMASIAGIYGYYSMKPIKGVNKNFEYLMEINDLIGRSKQVKLNYVLTHEEVYLKEFEQTIQKALLANSSIDEVLITNKAPKYTDETKAAIEKYNRTMQAFFEREKAKIGVTDSSVPIKKNISGSINSLNSIVVDEVLANRRLSRKEAAERIKKLQVVVREDIAGVWGKLNSEFSDYLKSGDEAKVELIDGLFSSIISQTGDLKGNFVKRKSADFLDEMTSNLEGCRVCLGKIEELTIEQAVLNEYAEKDIEAIGVPVGVLVKMEQEIVLNLLTNGVRVVLISLIGSVLLGLFISYYITMQVTKPLSSTVDLLSCMAKGDLGRDVPVQLMVRKDEFGNLASSLDYVMNKFRLLISDIAQESDQLLVSSDDMSTHAQHMSETALRQAALAQQLSASLNEVVEKIVDKAARKQDNDNLIDEAVGEIEKGSEAIRRTMKSILTVDQKNGLINNITTETDMLALNAAVEAARSGEHGKGFAVVAQEVRSLANRTKDTATEINMLTKEGVGHAKFSEKQFESLTVGVVRISDTLKTLTDDLASTNINAEEINATVNTLNNTIQSNAGEAQHNARFASVLKEKAAKLQGSISYFQV